MASRGAEDPPGCVPRARGAHSPAPRRCPRPRGGRSAEASVGRGVGGRRRLPCSLVARPAFLSVIREVCAELSESFTPLCASTLDPRRLREPPGRRVPPRPPLRPAPPRGDPLPAALPAGTLQPPGSWSSGEPPPRGICDLRGGRAGGRGAGRTCPLGRTSPRPAAGEMVPGERLLSLGATVPSTPGDPNLRGFPSKCLGRVSSREKRSWE